MESNENQRKELEAAESKVLEEKLKEEQESNIIKSLTEQLLKNQALGAPSSPPKTSTTLKTSSETLIGMKLISRDNAFGDDSDEYVSESIRVVTNIFVKPRPPPNTATSQKPLIELNVSSSNSTNLPSKEHKYIVGSVHSSVNIKILEAKVDLLLEHLANPPSALIPPVASPITA